MQTNNILCIRTKLRKYNVGSSAAWIPRFKAAGLY